MSLRTIVSTAPIDRVAIDILESVAPVRISESPDESTVLSLMEGAVGLVCRGEGKITGAMIEVCRSLKVIGRPGAGFDSVDIRAATAHGIPVVYAPVGGFAVAEGALALLLALVKRVGECDEVVRNGQWQKRYAMTTGDLMGRTLGIVGLGRIGANLARLAAGFEMRVLAADPFAASGATVDAVELVGFDDLLARADFVSINVPLNADTHALFNRKTIAKMKPGAILINTARGAVIEDLDVLAEALESGQLGGVGLDVFPQEPPDTSHRIFRHRRLLCAPHLMGVSDLAMDRIYRSMATDMVAVLQNQRPQFCVNPEVLS